MSRKRFCLKIMSIAAIVVSALFLILTIFSGVLLRSSGDGTLQFGKTRVAAVDSGSPDFPRGSLIGLMSGSIPENTPVAVRMDGVTVLTDSQLSNPDTQNAISRDQILGGVSWCVPVAGGLLVLIKTVPGLLLCLLLPVAIIGLSIFMLLRYCRVASGFGSYPLPKKPNKPTDTPDSSQSPTAEENDDPFPELDYRLKTRKPAVPPTVKTVVITQTRPASSAIRSTKGEVRIYASGQEKVLPLNVGRRVVTIGGYNIAVEISREEQRTEDITRELPVLRRERSVGKELEDTQKIEIIRDGR